jgi:hypothetical protein
MKKFLFVLISVSFILFNYGCNKDSGGGGTDPFGSGIDGGGTDGGTGNITFEIQSKAGQQGGTEFDFKASSNFTITRIEVSETTGSGYSDQGDFDGTTVFDGGTWYQLIEIGGVQSICILNFDL